MSNGTDEPENFSSGNFLATATAAIAAARKALAEGEAIVRETKALYGFKHGPRPLTRAWERGEFRRRRMVPVREDALSDWDAAAVWAVRQLLDLSAVTRKPGLRAACYREIGHQLRRLRYRAGGRNAPRRERWEWLELVKNHCKIGRTRAYELVALAKDGKTVAEERDYEARRKRRQRAKKQGIPDVPDKAK